MFLLNLKLVIFVAAAMHMKKQNKNNCVHEYKRLNGIIKS